MLLVNSSDTTISGSTFRQNTVTQFGGALSVGSGTLVVEDSTCVESASVWVLDGTHFLECSLTPAVTCLSVSPKTHRFTGNTAGASGGGINFRSVSGSTAALRNVTFADNTASEESPVF